MAIGGKKRESSGNNQDYAKKVGLFEANVIAVNPSIEDYKEVLGIELKDESKAVEYLGTSQDGNTTLRVDFWLEDVKKKEKLKVTFFLENKEKVNKDGNKKQYINSVGTCSWADDANNLPTWFSAKDYRVAFVGEEELYNFLRTWLGKLDYRDVETVIEISWKSLMKGNVKEISSQINSDLTTSLVALATVKTVEKDGEIKEYQGVYNKAFLPSYYLKQFRLINYNKVDVQSSLRNKKSKDLKPYERFVVNVTGEYGCKDFYTFSDICNYNSEDNIVASDAVMTSDGPDY